MTLGGGGVRDGQAAGQHRRPRRRLRHLLRARVGLLTVRSYCTSVPLHTRRVNYLNAA